MPQQQDTAVAEMSLEEAERYMAWSHIQDQFLGECLGPFLRERKVRLNCSTCDRILFSYFLRVDENGHIIEARQSSRTIRCNQLKPGDLKALDLRIQAYFNKLKLPPLLYNSTYMGPFSILLRC